jgi:hypothetical protein
MATRKRALRPAVPGEISPPRPSAGPTSARTLRVLIVDLNNFARFPTLAIGLLVAVPAVFAFNYLQGRNRSIAAKLNTFSTDLLAYMNSNGAVKPAIQAGPVVAKPAAKPAANPTLNKS